MLSKNLENSPSIDIFLKFWKKARVYHTLSISRWGPRHPGPPSILLKITLTFKILKGMALQRVIPPPPPITLRYLCVVTD